MELVSEQININNNKKCKDNNNTQVCTTHAYPSVRTYLSPCVPCRYIHM